jgi:nicotinamidase-related amidase
MNHAALLIIDVQKGLDDPRIGRRNNPDAETNMAMLLAEWRRKARTVVHVKHNSTEKYSNLRPQLPGNEIKEVVQPLTDEVLFEKSVNCAFIGTELQEFLQNQGIVDLVVVGLTTDHCVSSTVRMGSDLGFNIWLAGDATATHERRADGGTLFTAEQVHEITLASLNGEFCTVVGTADILAHPGL